MNFDMGKYAAFILPAFGATVIILAGLTVETLLRARYWRRRVEALEVQKADKRKAAKS